MSNYLLAVCGDGRRSAWWKYLRAQATPAPSVGASILGCKRLAVGAARAAGDAALLVTGIAGGLVPLPVVGHRAFDGEHATVVVGDNQVERLAVWFVSGHEAF
jgi:hypothetical protein